uniref:Uncharacterized protein n=1 Tax=Tanacetum cinerariifolium TaxID=118510 RepID=A0A6L2ML35_TANCI|nr:hypothetical protein [Tanacetum cinerariifolium]
MTEFPQVNLSPVVPVFYQGDDSIACLNKAMAFLEAVAFSRRQGQSYAGTSYKGNATSSGGNNAGTHIRVVKCYNCQGGQAAQITILNTDAFQTDYLDAYDSNCDDVSNAKAILMDNLSNYGSDVISEKTQWIKPTLYDGSVISSQHAASPVTDDEETLILEEVSRSKMLAKQNEPMSKEKKVNTTLINYVELNRLSEDFGKRFVPQQELSDEQAFCLQTSHPNTDRFVTIKIEAPREFPKEENVKHEMDEIETINIELEHSVTKLLFENEHLDKEIEHLKKIYKDNFDLIKKTRALSKEHSLQNELKRLKGKLMLDNATTINNAITIAPGMFKLHIEPLSHRLKKNRDAHENYLKKTMENTDTIRGLVECATES